MDKQYLLDEIKRTAAANGGKPLGRSRFAAETGIRESDWIGQYAARWSDLLREAGLEPNELQGAYPEDSVIEKYIELIRELGRIPVGSELRLKRREDVRFPSHNVFNRFGSKASLIQEVRTYCAAKGGLDDIIDLCDRLPRSTRPEPNAASEVLGAVYLLKSGRYYKVGRSNDVGRRNYEIRLQLPEKAILLHSIRTDDPSGIERYWHERFASKRLNGEWFNLTAQDVVAFKRRKFM